jgi:hypothetical protein
MARDTAPTEGYTAEATMFCPKCGAEAVEVQRFCKACGTNLQLINDALKGGGDSSHSVYGVDIEALKQNAMEFARSWKAGWNGIAPAAQRSRARHEIRRQVRDQIRLQNLPRPKEWLGMSWQHNLRSGLISLFSGAGLGFVLYYLGRTAINEGVVQRIEEASRGHVQGLEPLIRLIWLFALIPVLKGLAQIIYAAFFAESIATLSERFTVKVPQMSEPVEPTPSQRFERLEEPPTSVTEHTTKIIDEAGRAASVRRESQ